ncbi:hypothetical protein D0Z00_001092 [Geotrichum galactomycetum]|uniref:Uncharacterized protein n=1 Tax=Geotrichum galactomycetum TaxID=27317 RepID=A0ACB6V879_9ASCO|nr:hypothetical protein D0Z00_001092 [Geotrichum candidum]
MDPSMLLGILIKNQQDWDSWKTSLSDQKVIHISSDPVTLRRSSLSTGSDDEEEGFVDVVFEPLTDSSMVLDDQQEAPIIVGSTITDYGTCQTDTSEIHRTDDDDHDHNDSAAEIFLVPNEEREPPSIFTMEQESISASTANVNKPDSEGIVIEWVSENNQSTFPAAAVGSTSSAAVATTTNTNTNTTSSSAVSVAAADEENFHEVDEFGEDVGSLPPDSLLKRSTFNSISSSPVKVTGFESEEWEYMSKQSHKQQ